MTAIVVLTRYPDARAFLEAARRAAQRREGLVDVLEHGADAVRTPGAGPRTGTADPTAARALMDAAVTEAARARLAEGEELLDAAAKLVEGVSLGIGTRYAEVLERHYVLRESFAAIAADIGSSKSTAMRLRDAACDWVDFVGWARAIRGLGGA